MKVYIAEYTDCYYESSYGVISVHKSKRNALYACVLHRRKDIETYQFDDDCSYKKAKERWKDLSLYSAYNIRECEVLD